MVKKTFMAALLLCVSFISANAQISEVSKKPRVYVSYFTQGDAVPDDVAEMIRDRVINGLAKTQRFNLVDQYSEYDMKKEAEHRSTEAAMMADEKTRTQVISAAGHDYIFSGNVLKYAVAKKVDDEGKTGYLCSISYSVSVTEVATSTTVAAKTFEHGGTGGLFSSSWETEDKARSNAMTLIESDIEDFLITEFPLEGKFVTMDYEVKKDKLISCYIELGSDLGIKVGDFFTINIPTVRAGRASYTEVGMLRVTEVVDGTLSMCKVTKGAKEVLVALNAYLSLDEATQTAQPIKIKSCVAPLISL